MLLDLVNAEYILASLVLVHSLPSIWSLLTGKWRLPKSPNYGETLYEDEDGVATPESTRKFSNQFQIITIYLVLIIGIGLSIADVVCNTSIVHTSGHSYSDHSESNVSGTALLVPAWFLLILQFASISRLVDPVTRFRAILGRLWSCFLIAGLALATLLVDTNAITKTLTSCQLASILVLVAAIFSVRRRPDVYRNGRLVDRQWSISLWTKYSFYWGTPYLSAASKENFNNSDMPAMDHVVRSENATARFRNIVIKEDSLPLWIQISWAFRWELFLQWIAILFSNFFDVAPAFAVLQLLQYLESREEGSPLQSGAWMYVAGIVVSTTSSNIVDSRLIWWALTDIHIPLRSLLTGLVYGKLLKVEDASKPPSENQSKDEDATVDDTKTVGNEKSANQQDILNMFTVDCTQVALFGVNNTQYVNVGGKAIVTIAFLWLLVGWESLCAGLLGILCVFPINRALAAKYGKQQKALMGIRDTRTTVTTEALQGIRQIKFSAIEAQWAEKLASIREEELSTLWRSRLYGIYMAIASEFTPVILTAMSLATYSWIHGDLPPSVAFTSISLFKQFEGLVSDIPYLLVSAINAKISSDRIEKFLRLPEKPHNTFPGESISFHNASVSFPRGSAEPDDETFILRDLNIEFPNNSLSVISGPTGSGKSLLLAAILGEVRLESGYIRVPHSTDERFDSKATAADWIIPSAVAFVSQTPWIENATIKNNILFGLPLDKTRYQQVIDACALTQDLAIFEDGDQTEVGAQGISLSGGQKWRLTLARAFYSRAGIIIMDDVFSALDAHVGKHIYDNAVMGELAEGRTRILATHHVSLCLPRAKYAVRLSARGALEHAGSIEELRQTGELDEMLEDDVVAGAADIEEDEVLRKVKTNGSIAAIPAQDAAIAAKAPPKKLHEEETRETGRVKTAVYTGYLGSSGGWPLWIMLIVLLISMQGFTVGRTYWIKIWSNEYATNKSLSDFSTKVLTVYHYNLQKHFSSLPTEVADHVSPGNTTFAATSSDLPIDVHGQSLWFYLGIYCFISTISVLFSVGSLYTVYAGSIRASRKIFKDILDSVLRAPLRWLDTVPMGRILNRFTGDFNNLDSSLAENFFRFARAIAEMLGMMAAAMFVSPYILICAAVLLIICTYFGRTFLAASRTFKRLESINKSPVISHFAASLSGLSTIRAFAKSSEFGDRMFNLIDDYAACTWHNSLFRNWLRIRIAATASLFAGTVATFVITRRDIDASLAGFALSFALSFGYRVSSTINISTLLELDMNATERIFEYRDLTTEDQGGEEVRASWPEVGKVEVKGLELGYADDLPAILKCLTFTAEGNQRIGVIGRTGAGKSTLSLAFFRFLKARKGSIVIDGVDISKIKLHDLRKRLAIIPQDPVLFSGTIRSNLDPFSEFSDYQLREALMRVHLIPSTTHTPNHKTQTSSSSSITAINTTPTLPSTENKNPFLSLTSPIASSGSNLSQGQKQLLCLARAILSRPKVLLLDEATSAVDMATDLLIQRSIREEFANTTLLVIAHRLSTVADFDKILVMAEGREREFGSPRELLEKRDGGKDGEAVFRGMVEMSGEREELERMILGEERRSGRV
ncbi:hypothetical protein VTL71DRAFT_3536 [Oculimacula yallundae]|uniref:Uncharacterized protein n=1 Tax=Oculimacula yallundae TaxID=86028 RepID=A0ABR4C9B8_9HELO